MTERDPDPIGLTDELTPAEQAALADLLADPLVWDEPDPAVEDRVLAAILAEAGEPAPWIGSADADAGDRDAPARPASRRARSRRGARLVGVAGVAAAAAVVAVLALAVLRPTPESSSERLLALRPTQLAPADAVADARIDERVDGTRIILDVRGLPPAPEGTYYEAWLRKNPAVGVSAGTFHLRGGGAEQIELWSGVSPSDYPLVTITLQDEGKGGDSSGRVYLSGRLD